MCKTRIALVNLTQKVHGRAPEAIDKKRKIEVCTSFFFGPVKISINNCTLALIDNWQQRLEIFGPERAFLPLRLCGDRFVGPPNGNTATGLSSALNHEDNLLLHAGFPSLLPPTKCGKQVVFMDRFLSSYQFVSRIATSCSRWQGQGRESL